MKRGWMIVVLAASFGALGGSAQDNVSGSWGMVIDHPVGRSDKVMLTLQQDGETLTGRADDMPLTGTVEGNEIRFSYDVPATEVGPLTLTFEGTIDGPRMEGSATFGQMADGAWVAERED